MAPWMVRNTGTSAMVVDNNDWIYGVDVSHYQRDIQWDSVAAQKLTFAFVKATEGSDYVDSLFSRNWENMRRVGLRRGAYHFFRAYGCGYEQALHFLEQVDYVPGDMPPVLDVELTDGMPEEVLLEEMRIWLQTVEARLHVKPIIYTNQHFYDRYLAGVFDNHPLWIAKYAEQMPDLSTKKAYDFWQFTNKGLVSGIGNHVDMNVFTGGFMKLCNLCIKAPEAEVQSVQPVLATP